MIKAIIFDWVGTLYERNIGLFQETVEVLDNLRSKYELGLVSLAGQGIPKRLQEIKDTGILKYFDSVIVDTEKEKEQFYRCMSEMGVAPDETLVIGDRTKREIRVGNSLGCETYWIKKGDYLNEIPNVETGKPTETISSLKDLLGYI